MVEGYGYSVVEKPIHVAQLNSHGTALQILTGYGYHGHQERVETIHVFQKVTPDEAGIRTYAC